MKNHFFIPYSGNKREEVERIYGQIDFTGITTIVEPFCGSSALSVFIAKQQPGKFKYVLNDLDKNLMELLRIAKEDDAEAKRIEDEFEEVKKEIDKEKYKDYVRNGGLSGWLFGNKYYKIRAGMYPITGISKTVFKFSDYEMLKFLKTEDVTLSNLDGVTVIEQYDKESCFIFLDPPYINNCNLMYSEKSNNVYEHLFKRKLSTYKAKVMICHEKNWLFDLIFSDYISLVEYDKVYQSKQRKTTHTIVKNFL